MANKFHDEDEDYIYLRDHTNEKWRDKFYDPEYLIIFEHNVLLEDPRQIEDELIEIDFGWKPVYRPYRKIRSVKRRDIERDW